MIVNIILSIIAGILLLVWGVGFIHFGLGGLFHLTIIAAMIIALYNIITGAETGE